MANYSVDLFPYYVMILLGILGLIAVFLYIFYHIVKFLIQNRHLSEDKTKKKEKELNKNES